MPLVSLLIKLMHPCWIKVLISLLHWSINQFFSWNPLLFQCLKWLRRSPATTRLWIWPPNASWISWLSLRTAWSTSTGPLRCWTSRNGASTTSPTSWRGSTWSPRSPRTTSSGCAFIICITDSLINDSECVVVYLRCVMFLVFRGNRIDGASVARFQALQRELSELTEAEEKLDELINKCSLQLRLLTEDTHNKKYPSSQCVLMSLALYFRLKWDLNVAIYKYAFLNIYLSLCLHVGREVQDLLKM